MPYKRNINLDSNVEWTPSEESGGIVIGSKFPLPCFSLGGGGGGNYAMIDKYPSVDDATYNSTTGANKKDIFGFQNFGFNWNHYFDEDGETHPPLSIKLRARYDNAAGAIQAFIVVNGTEYEAENLAPVGEFDGEFVEYTFYWLTNPIDSEYWTYEELNGTTGTRDLQYVGYKKDSDNVIEAKVSRMYIESYAFVQAELKPNADTAIQWSRSGGSSNYENLLVYNQYTPYNYTDVQNEIDKFTFGLFDPDGNPYTIPDDSQITWVQPFGEAIRVWESGYKMQMGIWIDGTVYMQDTLSNLDTDTWNCGTDGWTVNPKTSAAFTPDDINGVGSDAISHIGYKHTHNGGTTEIAYLGVSINHYPNDEPV